jgi:hypothetical protein
MSNTTAAQKKINRELARASNNARVSGHSTTIMPHKDESGNVRPGYTTGSKVNSVNTPTPKSGSRRSER